MASVPAATPAPAPARARSPLGVAALVLLSIATSAFVFAAAINGPWQESEFIGMMGPVHVRRFCGRAPDAGTWRSVPVLGAVGAGSLAQRVWDACADFFWVLVVVFRNGLRTVLARGGMLLLTVAAAPVVACMYVDALRDSSPAGMLVLHATGVLALGQLITIGAALTLAYVPCHAWRRVRQVRAHPAAVFPPPPPPPRALALLRLALCAAAAVTFATIFVNVARDEWVTTNILFQLYPLVFVPLALWPWLRAHAGSAGARVTNTTPTDDGSVIVHANRQGAALYQGLSFILLAAYWFSLTLLYRPGKTLVPALVRGWRHILNVPLLATDTPRYLARVHTVAKDGGVVNDAEWLLFFDTLGIVTAQYLIVLIDAWVDEWQVSLQRDSNNNKKARRTHAQRFVAEDVRPVPSRPVPRPPFLSFSLSFPLPFPPRTCTCTPRSAGRHSRCPCHALP